MSNDRTLFLDYSDLTPFDYNSSYIEGNASSALLKKIDNPGQTFEQAFDSDSGFTYDSSKAEFDSGKVKSISYRPTYASLGHTFNLGFDYNWSDNAMVTTNNGATIVSNKLRCVGNQYIEDEGVINISGKGSIRLKLTALESGNPSAVQEIFKFQESKTSVDSMARVYHDTASAWRFDGNRADGSSYKLNQGLNTTVFTYGQTYELLMVWDFSIGYISWFVDGTRIGFVATLPSAGSISYLKIGGGTGANFDIDDFVAYSEPLYDNSTTNYTIGYTLQDYDYLLNTVDLPVFNYSGIGSIQSIDDVILTYSGEPRIIIGGYYHNGSSWVVSDGSYAQANTPAEFASEVINFPVEGEVSVVVSLVFPNSNTQAEFDYFYIEITGQHYSTDNIDNYIIVSEGTYLDGIGAITVDADYPTADTYLRVVAVFNNVSYNWSGSAWVPFDNDINNANTIDDFNDNIGSFDFVTGKLFKLKVFLCTDDETETPMLTSISMTYNFSV